MTTDYKIALLAIKENFKSITERAQSRNKDNISAILSQSYQIARKFRTTEFFATTIQDEVDSNYTPVKKVADGLRGEIKNVYESIKNYCLKREKFSHLITEDMIWHERYLSSQRDEDFYSLEKTYCEVRKLLDSFRLLSIQLNDDHALSFITNYVDITTGSLTQASLKNKYNHFIHKLRPYDNSYYHSVEFYMSEINELIELYENRHEHVLIDYIPYELHDFVLSIESLMRSISGIILFLENKINGTWIGASQECALLSMSTAPTVSLINDIAPEMAHVNPSQNGRITITRTDESITLQAKNKKKPFKRFPANSRNSKASIRFSVLEALLKFPDGITRSTMCRELELTPKQLQNALDGLIERIAKLKLPEKFIEEHNEKLRINRHYPVNVLTP